jgi:hypothetical protein
MKKPIFEDFAVRAAARTESRAPRPQRGGT